MNRLLTFALALAIVYILTYKKEPYVPRTFVDAEWTATRNDLRRVSGPFNTCAPERFEECAKVAMPHLSRY
jgi:hypothetical protein